MHGKCSRLYGNSANDNSGKHLMARSNEYNEQKKCRYVYGSETNSEIQNLNFLVTWPITSACFTSLHCYQWKVDGKFILILSFSRSPNRSLFLSRIFACSLSHNFLLSVLFVCIYPSHSEPIDCRPTLFIKVFRCVVKKSFCYMFHLKFNGFKMQTVHWMLYRIVTDDCSYKWWLGYKIGNKKMFGSLSFLSCEYIRVAPILHRTIEAQAFCFRLLLLVATTNFTIFKQNVQHFS